MDDRESSAKKAGKAVGANGIALAIPMVLVSFPLVFGLIGKYAAAKFHQPWILFVFVLLGLGLAIRECVLLIKKLEKLSK